MYLSTPPSAILIFTCKSSGKGGIIYRRLYVKATLACFWGGTIIHSLFPPLPPPPDTEVPHHPIIGTGLHYWVKVLTCWKRLTVDPQCFKFAFIDRSTPKWPMNPPLFDLTDDFSESVLRSTYFVFFNPILIWASTICHPLRSNLYYP